MDAIKVYFLGALAKIVDDYVPTVALYIVLDLLGHGGWKE